MATTSLRETIKMSWQIQMFAACLFCSQVTTAQTAPNVAEPRGELLYSTYCISCHTTQIHWRDKKLATDWASLKEQVRRWSSNTGLAWREDDIQLVALHLNTLYYHFPITGGQLGSSPLWQGPTTLPSTSVSVAVAKH